MRLILMGVLVLSVCLSSCREARTQAAEVALNQVQASHVEGNVPDQGDFGAYLQRDLLVYFRRRDESTARVEFQLLRQGPTQSGVALPKYYLWVQAFDGQGERLTDGAARVAAIEKSQFEVTHYLSCQEIRSEPDKIGTVFPAALLPDMRQRATASECP
jgi:hypothetical protein